MAIGSEPEIGKVFKSAQNMTHEDWLEWYKLFKDRVGSDCLGGYATLGYPRRFKTGEPINDNDTRPAG